MLRATYNHDDVSSSWNVSNGDRFVEVTIPIKLTIHEIVVDLQTIFKFLGLYVNDVIIEEVKNL